MNLESLKRGARALPGLLPVALVLALAGAALGAESAPPSPSLSAADQKLFQALQQTNLTLLQTALAEGADVNRRGTNGLGPLLATLAEARGPLSADQRQCVARLLEKGAALEAKDRDGRTALIVAARLGDLETVRLLVEAGAFVKARDRFHKTATLYAALLHRRDLLTYLGSNGDLQSHPYQVKKAESR